MTATKDNKWQEVLRGVIHPWHCDSFGHMNVRWYAHFFDDAAYHIWPVFWGSLQKMESEVGVHTVTGRATTEFRKELVAGDLIRIDCRISRLGSKSCSFLQRMIHIDTGEIHATCEITEVFFNPETRKSASMPEQVREVLLKYSS